MVAARGLIDPDDLVRIIEAQCMGGAGKGRGNVKGVEDMDRHDLGSFVPQRKCRASSTRGQHRALRRQATRCSSETLWQPWVGCSHSFFQASMHISD